jgi:hypothetical protein
MNIEGLEIRITGKRKKVISYWENDILVGKKCTKCGKNKRVSEFASKSKKEGGYQAKCKECQKQYKKQWDKENKEHIKASNEHWRKINPEYNKKWNEENKIKRQQCNKKWKENNNEHKKEYDKQYREIAKSKSIKCLINTLEQINPIFKQLNLPIYGYIYLFTNIKTKRCYVGQTIQPLKARYKSNIIQGWIEERLKYDTQKFKEELIEKDIEVIEMLDVAFCQYHLNKLEAYYIDKYNSCVDGYNNNAGYHNTNDGLEEFNKILSQYNIEFIDGEIKEKRLPKQA